jgi:hypothetical protein
MSVPYKTKCWQLAVPETWTHGRTRDYDLFTLESGTNLRVYSGTKMQGLTSLDDLHRWAGADLARGWKETAIRFGAFDGFTVRKDNESLEEKFYLKCDALSMLIWCSYNEDTVESDRRRILDVFSGIRPVNKPYA